MNAASAMWRSWLALAVLGCAGAACAGVAQAATFSVTSLANAGPGSLRVALDAANAAPGADAIGFTVTGTIALTTAELTITDDLTLSGPGIAALTVSGENARRVFSVDADVTATISGMTIANGRVAASAGVAAPASGGSGGAGGGNGGSGMNINSSVAATDGGAGVRNAGNLVLRDVRLVANTVIAGRGGDATATAGAGGAGTATAGGIGGNASATGGSGGAGQGGAIFNTGTLLVERATITGNTVTAGSAGTAIAAGGDGGDGGGTGPGGIGGAATATAGSGGPGRGGAISNAGSLTLRETSLTANTVTAGAGSTRQSTGGTGGTAAVGSGGYGGGAVAPAGSTAGSASGAGIHNGGTVTVEASTIASNRLLAGAGGNATANGGAGGNGGSPGGGGDGGAATTAAGAGGVALAAAILNDGVNLRIYNTTIADNSAVNGTIGSAQGTGGTAGAGGGGGGGDGGNATVAASAGGFGGGGGVTNLAGRTVTLSSATITGNSAPIGANLTNVGTATAINTIVADGIGGGASCAGTITSRGFNLDDGTTCGFTQPTDQSSVDPRLGALGDNGGPTRTRIPQAGSPAIERGTSDGFRTDQRGLARPYDLADVPTGAGDGSDIGAVEVQPLPAPAVPAAPGSPAPAGAPAAPDTAAPSLLAARLSPKSFAVGSRGSVLAYTLSEPARVRVTIARRTGGRRVGTVCRKQTKANRSRRSCIRYATVVTLTQSAKAGANTLRISSRPAGRRLSAGRYRITIIATDAAGNRSPARRLTFTVVRR